MDLVRIEHIKAEFVALNSLVRTMKKQGLDVAKGGFNAIFVGNTATGEIQRQPHPAFNHSNAASAGKTTIAELYASYLHSVEAIPYDNILRISAINLDTLGVQGVERKLGQLDLGGAFILEEIPPHSRVGLQRDPRRLPLPFIQGRRAARKGCFHFLPAAESTWTRFAHPVRRFPAYSQRCSGRGGTTLCSRGRISLGAPPFRQRWETSEAWKTLKGLIGALDRQEHRPSPYAHAAEQLHARTGRETAGPVLFEQAVHRQPRDGQNDRRLPSTAAGSSPAWA